MSNIEVLPTSYLTFEKSKQKGANGSPLIYPAARWQCLADGDDDVQIRWAVVAQIWAEIQLGVTGWRMVPLGLPRDHRRDSFFLAFSQIFAIKE